MSDITIKIKDREGVVHELQAPTDMAMNIMELCKAYELPVEGTCGGMAMCASCQCYILSDHELPEKQDAEEDMLDQAFYVEDNSRLGCQLAITEDLDGLEIELAPESEV
ncbi:2Fe-2S ferredoxin [Wenyingzhuangia heitensis]|uniref:2Fe-2S ferredoxin n=1 Tax=Wenyingzhuangia heitensis TaxID=1487859 RepID=A0ABX0U7U5_9FLAO|nr:2Fe-2S iron-sulfur cluster-binding protein [Wenyingzhuangia heitensis]NIJ44409.1 2Fe-2S ferredoxin [Wenyingzhuangia heitensis]